MTPTEQDKELREKINSLFESVFSQGMRAGKDVATETYEDFDAWHKKGETDEIMQLIAADRKRVALEARLDEMKLHRHEWALFGDRPPYKGESVSLPILLAYHDDRIAELKAQQEEV